MTEGKERYSCQGCSRDDVSLTANGRLRSHTANGKRRAQDNPNCPGGSAFPVQDTSLHAHRFEYADDGNFGHNGSFCAVDDCGMAEPDDHPEPAAAAAPVHHVYEDGAGGVWEHPGTVEDCNAPDCNETEPALVEDERPTAQEYRDAEAVVMSGTATPDEEQAAGSVLDRATTLGIRPPAQDDGHTHVIRKRNGVMACLKCNFVPKGEAGLCICRAKNGVQTHHDAGCPLFDPKASRRAGPNPHRAPLSTSTVGADDFLNGTVPAQRPAQRTPAPAAQAAVSRPASAVSADDFLNGGGPKAAVGSPPARVAPALNADDFLNGGSGGGRSSGTSVAGADADDFLNGGGEPEDDGTLQRGNWFESRYDGECGQCFERFLEEDEIRADGEGGWQGRDCCGQAEDDEGGVSGQENPETLLRVKLRVKNGRYHAPHPVTGKNAAYTRVTNFIKLASDHFALDQWSGRMTLLGLVRNPKILPKVVGIFDGTESASIVAKKEREFLNGLVEDAKTAAGHKDRANKGTALHDHTEMVDTGRRKMEDIPEEFRAEVQVYREALADQPFEVVPYLVEKSTAHTGLGVAGTFDRVYRVTRDHTVSLPNLGEVELYAGEHVIGDVKTGDSLEYALLEIATQESCYARGVNESGVAVAYGRPPTWRWVRPGESLIEGDDSYMVPKVREDIGVVMHVPYAGGQCTVEWLDLKAGWANAELCKEVQDMQKAKINRNVRAAGKTYGAPKSAPVPAADPAKGYAPPSASQMAGHPSVNGSAPKENVGPAADQWRDLMRNVATREEASRTYQSAKKDGADLDLLKELAAIGAQTLERAAGKAELDRAAADRERVDRAAAKAHQEKKAAAEKATTQAPYLLNQWRQDFADVSTKEEASQLYQLAKKAAEGGVITTADLKELAAIGQEAIREVQRTKDHTVQSGQPAPTDSPWSKEPSEPSPAAVSLAEDKTPATDPWWTNDDWIRAFGNVKNRKEASELRAKALSVGVPADVLKECTEAALAYLAMIDTFAHVGSKEEALTAYRKAKGAGITGERLAYLVERGKDALVPF